MSEERKVAQGRHQLGRKEAALFSLLIVPPGLLLLAFFIAPLVDMVWRSFGSESGPFGYYVEMLTDPIFRSALTNSIKFAALTGLVTVVLAYPVALMISGVRASIAGLLMLLVMIPFWTSVLVRSYAWIIVLGRNGVLNTNLTESGVIEEPLRLLFNELGVIIGMVHVMLPYAILPLISAITNLDKDLIAAAGSLGASRLSTFRRVILPLTAQGAIAGFVLVFVLSLGFFITPALMGGPTEVVTAMVIHEQVTEQLQWGQAAAAAVILLILTVGSFLACVHIFNLREHMSFTVGK